MKVGNDCTGVGSRSGGTATKCSADSAVDAGGVRVEPFEGRGRLTGLRGAATGLTLHGGLL